MYENEISIKTFRIYEFKLYFRMIKMYCELLSFSSLELI